MAVSAGDRKVYSFKSVGETNVEFLKRATQDEPGIPVGLVTPLQFGRSNSGLLRMHFNLGDQIKDNLRNLIQTNHGERLGLYDFGANLVELAFELGAEDADTEAIRRIKVAAGKYMPFVNLQSFEHFNEKFDNEAVARIGLRITYTVPQANLPQQMLEVTIFSAG
ncbi:MAG TPA: hypothetical protein EYG51_18615 [Pseudomonadales bacterium]|nr:hypothetical protein [Rhodospirillales bacterium]HIL97901.1 hypothetical protein [Pseudomonadales bacterium]